MKKFFIILGILMLMVTSLSAMDMSSDSSNTEVLVVGTIHQFHQENPNYSYANIVDIAGTYNPDVICVEILPSQFRTEDYLQEMIAATLYGLDTHIAVYPIDWGEEIANARYERWEYVQTEEYAVKEQEYLGLMQDNSIIQAYVATYGEGYDVWFHQGYQFFNGAEFNEYQEESYRISLDIFGDGLVNLYYKTRNDHMVALIEEAIAQHAGQRVLVYTGAEHKHYFDQALSARDDIEVVDFASILPLQATPFTEQVAEYFDNNLLVPPKGYFTTPLTPEDVDNLYGVTLIPVMHGPGMDQNPSTIPADNFVNAKKLIEMWSADNPDSVWLQFEQGWIAFGEGRYDKALQLLEGIADHVDEIPIANLHILYYRNLGWCYDVAGERERAITTYRAGEDFARNMGATEEWIDGLFLDYEEEPYLVTP